MSAAAVTDYVCFPKPWPPTLAASMAAMTAKKTAGPQPATIGGIAPPYPSDAPVPLKRTEPMPKTPLTNNVVEELGKGGPITAKNRTIAGSTMHMSGEASLP